MAADALTTATAAGRRLPSDTPLVRVLTTTTPGEILLGSDDTGAPVLRIATSTTREDLKAAVVALIDLLARMEPALEAVASALAPDPSRPLRRFDDRAEAITHTAEQVRAAYRSNSDRLPANLRGGARMRRRAMLATAILAGAPVLPLAASADARASRPAEDASLPCPRPTLSCCWPSTASAASMPPC